MPRTVLVILGIPRRKTGRWRLHVILLLVLLTCVVVVPRANGHSMPQSLVQLDFLHDSVAADLTLPMNELELSFKQPLMAAPETVVARYEADLRRYLVQHIHPLTPDGREWSVNVTSLGWKPADKGPEFSVPDVLAHVVLRPPPGAPLRRFTLHYSVICHEVMSHIALVSVRNDWNSATFAPPQPRLLGAIQFVVTSIEVDRTQGSFWKGFQSVFMLGMRHIAGGLDHLLFLFVLLLPAPLLVAGNRWGEFGGTRRSVVQLVKIVTAFTLGHSLTLIIGGFGWLRLPAQPVEVLIAVSILVSAVHAIRPWFAGKEPWIAAGFGLIHGLAFASSLAGFGFSPVYLATAIFGFNVGIEVMQLAIVVALVPVLMLLSQSRCYSAVRVTGATLASVAALYWIGARLGLWTPVLNV